MQPQDAQPVTEVEQSSARSRRMVAPSPRERALPRLVIPFRPRKPSSPGTSLEYRAPVPSRHGAKVLCRNARSTKRKRIIWDETFPKLCKNGLRMG